MERGHRAAGLLGDGREEGGLVSGQPRGAGGGGGGDLGDAVHDDGLTDQAAPWLCRLGDPVNILEMFSSVT